MRARIAAWRAENLTVSLVPTMGGLHEGHMALVRRAGEVAERVCVSLFVNPGQFGPNEDYASYPRDEAGDAAKLNAAGVHLLFAPEAAEIYAPGQATQISVPGLGDQLEGAFRPGFFTGVATVVTKLLLLVGPDVALFGDKDYQQLLVVRRLVTDLGLPVAIEGVATVREDDGLALSSRNAYLTPDERRIAPTLYKTIRAVAERMAAGAGAAEQIDWAERELRAAGFTDVDYVAVCDAETLAPVERAARPARVLVAARLGRARLIDNVAV